MSEYFDQNGNSIVAGRRAEVVIKSGEKKRGNVTQVFGLVTIRSNVTDQNPDGILYSVEPEKVTMLQGVDTVL